MISLFLVLSFLFSSDKLDQSDIGEIMNQILSEHVKEKTVSSEILKKSLANYINQFDSHKTYLLEGEVRKYLKPTESELEQYVEDYRRARYTPFEEMNNHFQKAIKRSRRLRKWWREHPEELFDENHKETIYAAPYFSKTLFELRERIRKDMILFIRNQKKTYGSERVSEKKAAVLELYDASLKEFEDSYLIKSEHLFSIHVLKALAKSLDAHTTFFNAEEAEEMRSRLKKGYEGTGVFFTRNLGGVVVDHIVPGSPASRAIKLKVGDQLIAVDGKRVDELTLEKAMDLLEGKIGTTVFLNMKKRGGQKYHVRLVREKVTFSSGRVETTSVPFKDGIIGTIALHSFYRDDQGISSVQDVENAVNKLKKQGPLYGLVIDLRDNGGGYLSQAVKVAGLFITNGVIVVSKYDDGEKKFYRDIDQNVAFDGPLVILVSKLTASAAEIVTGALQDYGVALVVGDDRTYGKGTIQRQTVTEKTASSFFKVTVGKYYTVSGKTPQLEGIKSDIIVPGKQVFKSIGERFKNNQIRPDTIESSFDDQLEDVETLQREWFVRYYLPHLQQREHDLKQMVPRLRLQSQRRTANFKQGLTEKEQLAETIHIIKDMNQ